MYIPRRAPRGARGLKSCGAGKSSPEEESCPSRGTWIEIITARFKEAARCGRAPRGARGLKYAYGGSAVDKHIVVPLAGHVD